MSTRHRYTNKEGNRVDFCVYCGRKRNSKLKYGRTPNNCFERIKPLSMRQIIKILQQDIIFAKEEIAMLKRKLK